MKPFFFLALSFVTLTFFILFILNKENEKVHHHFDWTGIRKEIRDTLIAIDHLGNLDGPFRGVNGTVSQQYKRILWFRKNVTIEEAERLAKYPSAPIKVLAFHELLGKRHPAAIEMLRANIQDTTWIYYGSGCEYQQEKLNEYLFNTLKQMEYFDPEYENFVSEQVLDSIEWLITGTLTSVMVGDWKLVKVIAPWSLDSVFPENEKWIINSEYLNVTRADSIEKTIGYKLLRTRSVFTDDSVWVIQADFRDKRISTNLEIHKKKNKMVLLDQCEDCYSFEFEKVWLDN